MFPDDEVIRGNGYSTMTQPEGIVTTEYLRRVRETSCKGRPFATSIDWHGPLPVGASCSTTRATTPPSSGGVRDLAERDQPARLRGARRVRHRVRRARRTSSSPAAPTRARMAAFSVYQQLFGGVDEKAAYLTLHWNDYATAWDHLDYTVSSTFGGWAASDAGLDADGFSHEQPCQVLDNVWKPHPSSCTSTTSARCPRRWSCTPRSATSGEVVEQHDLGGADRLRRHRHADHRRRRQPVAAARAASAARSPGRSSRCPTTCRTPTTSATCAPVTPTRIVASCTPADVRGGKARKRRHRRRRRHDRADAQRLQSFAERGGNVVLTDSALKLLPELLGVDEDGGPRPPRLRRLRRPRPRAPVGRGPRAAVRGRCSTRSAWATRC